MKKKNIKKELLTIEKFKDYSEFRKLKRIEALKKKKPKLTHYLHFHKKLKKGIFIKKPLSNEIKYPFYLNLKLIYEFLKKR